MSDETLLHELHGAFERRTAHLQNRVEPLPLLARPHTAGRRRGGVVAPMVAVAASVVAALVLATQLGVHSGHRATSPGAGVTASGPYPVGEYFLASRGWTHGIPDVVVVRAADGSVVTPVPATGFSETVLAPDGSRVYGAWGGAPGHVGYYDFATGHIVTLDTQPGILAGVTVSGDGSTLAYEWDAVPGQPETSTSVVVMNLATGAKTVLTGAPAGPQVMSMSLSPTGTRLAVIATDTSTRPLLLVDTTRADAFQQPLQVAFPPCKDAWTAEPRWTSQGLYALRSCATPGFSLVRVDLATRTVQTMHDFGPAGILAYTVIPDAQGDAFAVSDESVNPPTKPVLIYRPAQGWATTAVAGVQELIEITSE